MKISKTTKKILIATIILFVGYSSLICQESNTNERKLSVNFGGQYYLGLLDQSSFQGIPLEIDFQGLLLNIGGEFKLSKKLSTSIDIGLLGKETFSATSQNNWVNIVLDPIRFHFSEVFQSAYIGPRVMFTSVTNDNSTVSRLIPGLVLGFNYSRQDLPLNIGFNVSANHVVHTDEPYAFTANFTIGILL